MQGSRVRPGRVRPREVVDALDLAGLARAIREFYADDPRRPDLLRYIDDRLGELLSG